MSSVIRFRRAVMGSSFCEMEGADRSTSMVAQSNFLGNAGRARGRRHYQPCHAPLPRSGLVQSLLCRPLDYADHWLRTGSGGGDRCFGVGIITVPPEMREAYHSVENDREWLPLELSRPARVP